MTEIYYDASQQWVLNFTLALMVLGLALDVNPKGAFDWIDGAVFIAAHVYLFINVNDGSACWD